MMDSERVEIALRWFSDRYIQALLTITTSSLFLGWGVGYTVSAFFVKNSSQIAYINCLWAAFSLYFFELVIKLLLKGMNT